MSLVANSTLEVGYLFLEDSIGSFRSGMRGGFVSERYVPKISEGHWKEDPLYDFCGLVLQCAIG